MDDEVLEQVVDHVIAARAALDRGGPQAVRILLDMALLETGRYIASGPRDRDRSAEATGRTANGPG